MDEAHPRIQQIAIDLPSMMARTIPSGRHQEFEAQEITAGDTIRVIIERLRMEIQGRQ